MSDVASELKKIDSEINSIERRLTKLRAAGGGADHNILSATHLDSVAAGAVRGDIIIANSTPRWTRLPRGADNQLLTMNGLNPNWEDPGGAVGEADIQFLDNFDDNSIWWLWNLSHLAPGMSITEPVGTVLNIQINAGTAGNWWSTSNAAPRILTGIPGYPLFIETKITSWNDVDNQGGGICFSRIDANANANFIALIIMKIGGVISLDAGYGGGSFATVSPYAGGFPLWFRIYASCLGRDYDEYWFYYSNDGAVWNQVGAGPYSNVNWTNLYGVTGGLFVKNWTTNPLTSFNFDHYIARRLFGPG